MKPTCSGTMLLSVLALLMYSDVTVIIAQSPYVPDCVSARHQYETLNRPLLILKHEDIYTSEKVLNSSTINLNTFVADTIVQQLNSGRDANDLSRFLSCMQDSERDKPWSDITNTPVAFTEKNTVTSTVVSGILVMRGGTVIPATAPLLQCYVKRNGQWSFVGASGSDYDGSTFYVYPLRSPVQNESWFLLAGKTIGGTWSNVNLEVATCNGSEMKVKWKKDGFYGGSVEVTGGTVAVTYSKREKDGTVISDREGYAIEFTDVLHVTPRGLE